MKILGDKYQSKGMKIKLDYLNVIRIARKRVEWTSNIKRLGEYTNTACILDADCQIN
jgi:hypothetical protein